MGLLTPLGLLGLLLLIPVIAMYLLKRRREEALVSSTFLWERTLQDLEANAPWQKLRRNLLLLLQLIVLTLLAIALARPFVRGLVSGRSLIVVLDSSVSMATQDMAGQTRMQAATGEVQRLGESLDGGRITVIRAGDGAELLLGNSNDTLALRQALDSLRPTATTSDLGPALTLAAAAAERQPDSEIVVVSDGAVQVPPVLATGRPVRFVPVGTSSANQAISLMELRQEGDESSLLVGTTNYDSQPITRRLSILLNGQPFTALDVEMQPNQPTSQVVPLGSLTADAVVEATLIGSDALPEDDHAWAVPGLGGERTARLLTPDPASPYLRYLSVPISLAVGSELSVAQAGAEDAASSEEPADLLVVNHWLPADGLPGTTENLLILNPPPGNPLIEASGVLTNPIPLLTGALPAVSQGLRFEDDLFFVEARQTPLPDWGSAIIEDGTTGQPLLWVGERDGRRIAVLNLILFGTPETSGLQAEPSEALLTNLLFQPTYPLLMARLVDYLAAGPAGSLAGRAVLPGESMALPLLGPRGVEVTLPDGTTRTLQPAEGARTVPFTPEQPGPYRIRWPEGAQEPIAFTANLILPGESAIAPQPALALETTAAAGGATPDPTAQEGRQLWWRPVALLALLFLALEWLVYQKDALARLRRRFSGTDSRSKRNEGVRG